MHSPSHIHGWKWVGWPRQSGSFFWGSSGSHPQTKLAIWMWPGCDLDITCSFRIQCWHLVAKWVNCEWTLGLMNALKYHWCEINLLSQTVLKHVERFHLQEVCMCKGPVLYPAKNEEIYMASVHIKNFSCHVSHFKMKTSIYARSWVTSSLFCGSMGQIGQQVQPTFNPVMFYSDIIQFDYL